MNPLTLLREAFSPVSRGVKAWYKLTPTQVLLFEHNLPPNPVIFDVGGYIGEAAEQFAVRYPKARLHIFEPVEEFCAILRNRLPKAKVYGYGLGARNETQSLSMLGEGSSAFREGDYNRKVVIRSVNEVFNTLGKPDLMMINAEGAEYPLLEKMIELDILPHTLVIQFHRVGMDERKAVIQAALSKTHEKVFEIPWVWEKWVARR